MTTVQAKSGVELKPSETSLGARIRQTVDGQSIPSFLMINFSCTNDGGRLSATGSVSVNPFNILAGLLGVTYYPYTMHAKFSARQCADLIDLIEQRKAVKVYAWEINGYEGYKTLEVDQICAP